MHLPTAMLDILRTGLATAALATVASGCASARPEAAQAPFAGMGARANPPAPTVRVIAPGTTPFATPIQPTQPVAQPVVEPVAQPVWSEPVPMPRPEPKPPGNWECGPCGMG
jgi:hypothetical protein